MKAIGDRTSSMDMERRLGPTKQSIVGSTATVRSTARANFYGRTIVATKDSFNRTTFMDLENTFGRMEGLTKVNGRIIRWKGKEFSLGWMEGDTKANTRMIRKKDLECLRSETVEFMKESGKTANSTEEESLRRKIWLEKVYGRMDKE